jgi:hypothetical protein
MGYDSENGSPWELHSQFSPEKTYCIFSIVGKIRTMNTFNRILRSISKRIDVEMWQKGWWMLLLIIGTIGMLFTIGAVLMAKG